MVAAMCVGCGGSLLGYQRSRRGTGPISRRSTTDLGAELDRSRRAVAGRSGWSALRPQQL
ncbi:hypothetical protein HMPREF1318_1082 [Actinomyces massiliensis F0489]|uniref:Uncharacterized protein n=1 Tax=Actinomyces massiliensis F0489 TaxID=1125718 RepID=J1HLM6_9ACTO|nr:hypothetical protein HMPREF1318_1082 [Actinomyces massiliensis F0489]